MSGDDWARWRADWNQQVPPPLTEAGYAAVRRRRWSLMGEALAVAAQVTLLGAVLAYGPQLADRIWVAALLTFFALLWVGDWSDRRWSRQPLAETTHTFLTRYREWCERRVQIARAATWLLVLEGVTLVPLAALRLTGPSETDADHRFVSVIAGGILLAVAMWRSRRGLRRTELRLASIHAVAAEQDEGSPHA